MKIKLHSALGDKHFDGENVYIFVLQKKGLYNCHIIYWVIY